MREALGRAAPLELAAGEARVSLARAAFADVVVSTEGGRAMVVAVVEADGKVHAGGAHVSLAYVGREAFTMERCSGRRWCAAGPPLPALAGVIEALVAAPRPDGRRPLSWQVRIERDRATAGEDAALPGGPSARGVIELARERGRWRIASGP